jgi:adenine C2-methylase RlmN of 23S rRNA A2503 and tRNA A37
VNLIQYNAIDQGPYQQAGVDAVEAYRIRLLNAGVAVSIRRSRGSDIDAACGQLAGNLMGEVEATAAPTAPAVETNVSLNLKTL